MTLKWRRPPVKHRRRLAALMPCSGPAVSPMPISGFGLIEGQVPPARRTEAMARLTSAISVGTAVGSAAAGRITDTAGARSGYALAAFASAATLACLPGLTELTYDDNSLLGH
jgi:predicted MFS family arabinose efflux permease